MSKCDWCPENDLVCQKEQAGINIDGLVSNNISLREENKRLIEEIKKLTKYKDMFLILQELCGSVYNGSNETVTIFQDEATRDWFIRVGGLHSKVYYYGETLEAALIKANLIEE